MAGVINITDVGPQGFTGSQGVGFTGSQGAGFTGSKGDPGDPGDGGGITTGKAIAMAIVFG